MGLNTKTFDMSHLELEYKRDTGTEPLLSMQAHITDKNNVKVTKYNKPLRRMIKYGTLIIASPEYVKWLEEKLTEKLK
jgi:hypothetical protein